MNDLPLSGLATTARERPILFSAPMVRQILAGAKTQTRRPAKSCGVVGDVLWVRESWCEANDQFGAPHIVFMAGGRSYLQGWTQGRGDFLICDSSDPDMYQLDEGPKRASIHLPKHWARLWLEIIDVRAERLQEISEADARCEGVASDVRDGFARPAFIQLWNSINGKTHPWKSNPWVWVVTFKRLEKRP